MYDKYNTKENTVFVYNEKEKENNEEKTKIRLKNIFFI